MSGSTRPVRRFKLRCAGTGCSRAWTEGSLSPGRNGTLERASDCEAQLRRRGFQGAVGPGTGRQGTAAGRLSRRRRMRRRSKGTESRRRADRRTLEVRGLRALTSGRKCRWGRSGRQGTGPLHPGQTHCSRCPRPAWQSCGEEELTGHTKPDGQDCMAVET